MCEDYIAFDSVCFSVLIVDALNLATQDLELFAQANFFFLNAIATIVPNTFMRDTFEF